MKKQEFAYMTITKGYLDFIDNGHIEVKEKGCTWPSLEDPFSEELHSFAETLCHLAEISGFQQARGIYNIPAHRPPSTP